MVAIGPSCGRPSDAAAQTTVSEVRAGNNVPASNSVVNRGFQGCHRES